VDTSYRKERTACTFVYKSTQHYKPKGQDGFLETAYAIWYAASIYVSRWISSSTKHTFQQIFFSLHLMN